jgi:hypothetical protein
MKRLATSLTLLISTVLCARSAFAQGLPWLDELPASTNQTQQLLSEPGSAAQAAESMAPAVATTTAPSSVTIPAGTRVLMVLESPLHTTSGTAGSGIYLRTLFPVIQDNRIVIPAHTQVLGVVEANRRPGHVNRSAEFGFRFTSLIFPNNHVAAITGVLQSIPGAKNVRTQDKSGTLKTVDQTEKVVTPVAAYTVGGAIIGSASRFGIGKFTGAGLGAALGLGSVLLKRGDEITLAHGTHIEMVLQSPLSLEEAQVEANARYLPPQPMFNQPVGAPPSRVQEPRRRPQISERGLAGLLVF